MAPHASAIDTMALAPGPFHCKTVFVFDCEDGWNLVLLAGPERGLTKREVGGAAGRLRDLPLALSEPVLRAQKTSKTGNPVPKYFSAISSLQPMTD